MSIQEIILNGLNSIQQDVNLQNTFKNILKNNGSIRPNADIIEKEDKIIVLVEIPGINKEDIDIEFFNNKLNISGEKINKYKDCNNIEINYGKFDREIILPISVTRKEHVILEYIDGILSIIIDKEKERDNSFKCQISK